MHSATAANDNSLEGLIQTLVLLPVRVSLALSAVLSVGLALGLRPVAYAPMIVLACAANKNVSAYAVGAKVGNTSR